MARTSSISSKFFISIDDVSALKAKVESQQAEITTLKSQIASAKDIAISNDSKISNIENVVISRGEFDLAIARIAAIEAIL